MLARIMKKIRLTLLCLTLLLPGGTAFAESCRAVAHALNRQLHPQLDATELAEVLVALNNGALPEKFIAKREARRLGWEPGEDLWRVPGLRGRSMGGDHFGNREGRLPPGAWREADLDYRGGHRGAKRLLFSGSGRRFVTVDHYRTFVEVPPCQ